MTDFQSEVKPTLTNIFAGVELIQLRLDIMTARLRLMERVNLCLLGLLILMVAIK